MFNFKEMVLREHQGKPDYIYDELPLVYRERNCQPREDNIGSMCPVPCCIAGFVDQITILQSLSLTNR